MSIFQPIPRQELGTTYTHRGWMFGIVPVYVGKPYSEGPLVTTRNGVPDWLFDFGDLLWTLTEQISAFIDPDFESPGFPIRLTGRIKAAQ